MKRIVLFIFLFNALRAMAQQVPDFYHSYLYPSLLNPAATGMQDYTEFLALYKNQWVGIPDAPQTQLMMLNTPIKQKKLGLGFTIYNDITHIIGNTGGYGSLAYQLHLSENHQVNFGLSMGAFHSRIFFDKIRADDPFESSLLSNSENSVKADGSAGVLYKWKSFCAGFSSQHLFQNSSYFYDAKENKSMYYKLVRHYDLFARYKFSIHQNFDLEPMILIRSAQGLPSQAEVNSTLRYKEKVWINVSYRHQASAGISLGILLENKLNIGCHYEYPTSDVRKVSQMSYELALSYRFGGKKQISDSEGIEKLQKENEEQYEMIDQLEKKTDTIKDRLDQHGKEILQLKEIYKKDQEETAKLKKEEEVPVSKIENESPVENEDKIGAVHSHFDCYVVIGTFSNVQNAKLFQQVIKRDYNLDSRLALSRPNGGKSSFIVYSKVVRDSEDAKKEISRLKGLDRKNLFGKEPWLYRVK